MILMLWGCRSVVCPQPRQPLPDRRQPHRRPVNSRPVDREHRPIPTSSLTRPTSPRIRFTATFPTRNAGSESAYFKWNVGDRAGSWRVEIDTTPTNHDFDLFGRDDRGTGWDDRDESGDGDENITISVLSGGHILIHVINYRVRAPTNVTLTIIPPAPVYTSDPAATPTYTPTATPTPRQQPRRHPRQRPLPQPHRRQPLPQRPVNSRPVDREHRPIPTSSATPSVFPRFRFAATLTVCRDVSSFISGGT